MQTAPNAHAICLLVALAGLLGTACDDASPVAPTASTPTSAVSPAGAAGQALNGTWEHIGHGLSLKDGFFREYYFGSSVTVLPERQGTYTARSGRIGFRYQGTGIFKGQLPEDCPYVLTSDKLTICDTTYNRMPW
jgi:hypothetical protein